MLVVAMFVVAARVTIVLVVVMINTLNTAHNFVLDQTRTEAKKSHKPKINTLILKMIHNHLNKNLIQHNKI